MNTQRATVEKAVEKEADYALTVKGNQPALLEEITAAFTSLDEEQAKAKARWERSIEKARENRDEPRIRKLLEEGMHNSEASHWEEESDSSSL